MIVTSTFVAFSLRKSEKIGKFKSRNWEVILQTAKLKCFVLLAFLTALLQMDEYLEFLTNFLT